MKKTIYETPTIQVLFLEMEEGIATDSAMVSPGGSTSTPEIEDWNDSGSFSKDFDI